MMRARIRFWENKFYTPVGFDENLMKRKRSTLQEFGTLIKSLGVIEGYGRWLALIIGINMMVSTVWLLVPWLERVLLDEIYPQQNWQGFWIIFFIYIFVDVQGHLTGHVRAVLMTFLNGRMGMWLQVQYYRHLQRLPLTLIERKGVGDHMYRMHGDTIGILGMATNFIPNIIDQIYKLIMYLLFVSILDWRLTVVVAVYEVFYVISAQWLGTMQRKVEFFVRGTKGMADSRMQEGLNGVQTIKVFGRRKAEVGAFTHRIALQMRTEVWQTALNMLRNLFLRGRGLFPYMKDFLIMNFLYHQVITGKITYGLIFPMLAYLNHIGSPIEQLINLWQNVRFRIVWADRVFQIWDQKPGVQNVENPRDVEKFNGLLQAKDVTFEYEKGLTILKGINFTIEPEQFVAIVGASGSGKSTLLNLLIRLNDPTSGSILIDGNNIREYDYIQFQSSLGVVLQETFLSKETLRWNLMVGNYHATTEQMTRALERCRLGPWLRNLPDGLDSILNEGTRVSTGEKQRVGIARALLRNSNLLFLDEPTSSLDLDTEAEVMDVIHDVRRGKTTVMVTHRLNTIVNADKILVIDKGHLVETGTHTELMALNGHYAKLVGLYFAPATATAQDTTPAAK